MPTIALDWLIGPDRSNAPERVLDVLEDDPCEPGRAAIAAAGRF